MPTSTTSSSASSPPPRGGIIGPIIPKNRMMKLMTSLIIAIALLYVTILIVAKSFDATTSRHYRRHRMTRPGGDDDVPPPPPTAIAIAMTNASIVETTRIVYVPPTKEDLDRIKSELDASFGTSDENDDYVAERRRRRSADDAGELVNSVLSPMETLIQRRRAEERTRTRETMDELTSAYDTFVVRLGAGRHRRADMDDAGNVVPSFDASDLAMRLSSLRSILGGRRTSYADMDMIDMTTLFDAAVDELRRLSSIASDEIDDAIDVVAASLPLLNPNDVLLTTLMNSTTTKVTETMTTGGMMDEDGRIADCRSSYLDLRDERGTISNEFLPPPPPSSPPEDDDDVDGHVPSEDTARESDLYVLVEDIRRYISIRHGEEDRSDGTSHRRVVDDGILDDIRSTIIEPFVISMEERRTSTLAEEDRMRESWTRRMEEDAMRGIGSLGSMNDNVEERGGDGGGRTMCASTELVVDMVRGGLEALRWGDDLRSALKVVALATAAGRGNDDDDDGEVSKLGIDIDEVRGFPVVDDEANESSPPPPGHSPPGRVVGKRSILSNAVDVTMLHRGIVGWIDFFVDVISGYNDYVDSFIDWIVGDDGASVGKSIIANLSKLARKVPLGILAGQKGLEFSLKE